MAKGEQTVTKYRKKTHYMILTHSKYDSDNIGIKIRDNAITRVTSTKFLGIYIYDRLNYNVQTAYLTKQLSKTKGIIFELSTFVPNEILRNSYYALYYSKLVYAMAFWGGSGSTNINKISRSNNSTIDLFKIALPNNMRPSLQYNDVYKMISLSIFHKYKTKFDMHDNFYRKITNLIPQHNKHTRFALSTDYSVPMYYKTTGQNQYFYNAIKLLEYLTNVTSGIPRTDIFKNELKK